MRTSFFEPAAMALPIRLPIGLARRFSFNSGGNFTPSATTTMVKCLPDFLALANAAADVLDSERNFRNQNNVGAACDAGFERDPATVAAHHFNHHHAMMRGCGGVNLIDCIRDGVKRGIESERHLGGREIVVDSLRDADDLHSLLEKLVSRSSAIRRHRW